MLNARVVSLIALALIVGQLIIRGLLVATGDFYWDDLVLIARASSNPVLSPEHLFHAHDGHFMPATFLVSGVSTWLAPLNWTVPAVTLVALQALASYAVWRMIRTIAPAARVGALVALAFYLFTPMTLPAFAWWAAGLNTLPMQAAMAWIVADAVRLTRDEVEPRRRRTIWIRSSLVLLVALAFFEKSLLIGPVALVAAVLAVAGARARTLDDGPSTRRARLLGPVTEALRTGRQLWIFLAAVSALWVGVYLLASDPTAGEHSVGQTARLVWRSVNQAIVPSMTGGPWEWERWTPSPPTGLPSTWMIVGGWLLIAAIGWWALTRRRTGGVVVICAAVYAVGAQIPVMWNRSGPQTALELAQHMRYLPDTALVFTIAAALLLAAPSTTATATSHRSAPRHAQDSTHSNVSPLVAVSAVVGAFVCVSALVCHAAFSTSWRDNPTGDYLATATAALKADSDATLFDQSVPLEILQPVVYPDNQVSRIFGRVDPRPDFGESTDRLLVLDTAGNIVDGGVTQRRLILPGRGSCAEPEITGPTDLVLDGPLFRWPWTVAVGYCATRDGEIEMSLGEATVRAPVRAGLGTLYVRFDGEGEVIGVRPVTPGLRLHTGPGRVGEVVEARFAGGR